MSDWTSQELDTIGATDEIRITTLRPDGSLRSYVPVWIVRVGDALFVRSYRGATGSWYRHARQRPYGRIQAGGIGRDVRFVDADDTSAGVIDEAYRTKYGHHGGYVETMVRPDVAATTLRLAPER